MSHMGAAAMLLAAVFTATAAAPTPVENLLNPVDVADWTRECLKLFQLGGGFNAYGVDMDISSYDLQAMPHGLCTEWLFCSFENCGELTNISKWNVLASFKVDNDPITKLTAAGIKFNLPSYTAFPRSVQDVVTVVKHAAATNTPISVKQTGHSYAGSSTQKRSIQLNMRDFPKYTQETQWAAYARGTFDANGKYVSGPLPSTVWCAQLTEETMTQGCRVAQARGKEAIMRVGGGERWDDVYRGLESKNYYVQKNWNTTLEVIGGAAGSVGATGGWLQGNGLSYGAERLVGYGADHVVELEMVLASGTHVRFAPVAWEAAEGYLYPRTTKVAGFCNANVDVDETKWAWGPCDDVSIPFDDLWHAVRGGGGGTWGVVTAVTYQLHRRRQLEVVVPNAQIFGYVATVCTGNPVCQPLVNAFADFFTDLLFNPTNVGLDEATSVNCGSPSLRLDWASVTGAAAGLIYCHDGGAAKVLDAYAAYVANTTMPDDLQKLLQPVLAYWARPFTVQSYKSWAAYTLLQNDANPAFLPVWAGHMYDAPHPQVDSQARNCWSAFVPAEYLKEKNDFVRLAMTTGDAHVIGGRAGIAHDQTSALPLTQRVAGLQKHICDDGIAATMLQAFAKYWPTPPDAASIIGGAELNHIAPDGYGPLKANASLPCPSTYTHAQREAECRPYQEFVWGTEGLARLEAIKKAVDPQGLFNCQKCVGYNPER